MEKQQETAKAAHNDSEHFNDISNKIMGIAVLITAAGFLLMFFGPRDSDGNAQKWTYGIPLAGFVFFVLGSRGARRNRPHMLPSQADIASKERLLEEARAGRNPEQELSALLALAHAHGGLQRPTTPSASSSETKHAQRSRAFADQALKLALELGKKKDTRKEQAVALGQRGVAGQLLYDDQQARRDLNAAHTLAQEMGDAALQRSIETAISKFKIGIVRR